MKIGYLVPGANSINDILWINNIMQNVMRHARKSPLAKKAINQVLAGRLVPRCERCGLPGDYQVHHIKPVWAITVDYLLYCLPKSHQELYERARPTYYRDFDFSAWHNSANMSVLCSSCHLVQQKEDDDYWRNKLGGKYRLIYSNRWAMKAPTKQPAFSQYIDLYMANEFGMTP